MSQDNKDAKLMSLLAGGLCVGGWVASAFFAYTGNAMMAMKFDLVGYIGLGAYLVIRSIIPKD